MKHFLSGVVILCLATTPTTPLGLFKTGSKSQGIFETIERKDLEGCRKMLLKDPTIVHSFKNGYTPLHLACNKGLESICTLLIEQHAPLNIKDSSGHTPLHFAALSGSVEVIDMLLKAGADHWRDNRGYYPLHVVSDLGHVDACISLLNDNPSLKDTRTSGGQTPLQIACKKGRLAICYLLVAQEADINKTARGDKSPLHLAVNNGHEKIVTLLLEKGAFPNSKDGRDATPLHEASTENNLSVCELLLKFKADVNNQDESGRTPLHAASWGGHVSICELLLKYGADTKMQLTRAGRATRGDTPLHLACRNNYRPCCRLLLEYKAHLEMKNDSGETPLFMAFRSPFLGGHERAYKMGLSVAQLLIDHDAIVDVHDNEGYTPLHNVCAGTVEEECSFLLKNGALLESKNHKGQTALHEACSWGASNPALCALLLKEGADVNVQDHNGDTPLMYSVMRGKIPIIRKLLSAKGLAIGVKNKSGSTPLHVAVEREHADVCKLLLANTADVNAQDNDGTAPLMFCCKNENKSIFDTLCKHDDLIYEAKDDILEGTALHWACKKMNINFCTKLLKKGFDPNDTADTKSLLHLAVEGESEELIELILDNQTDPNYKDKEGNTPLHHACLFEKETSAKKLVLSKNRRGISLNPQNMARKTPLHCAVEKGNASLVGLLLKYGAQPHIYDKYQKPPLVYAAEKKDFEICSLISKKLSVVEFNDIKRFISSIVKGHSELEKMFDDYDSAMLLEEPSSTVSQAAPRPIITSKEILQEYDPIGADHESMLSEGQSTIDSFDQVSIDEQL